MDQHATWTVAERRPLPKEMAAEAAASQSTLDEGLGSLRRLPLAFPGARAPAAALQWIASGGTPHSAEPDEP